VAGTERGVTEPKATFSACFGAPFLPLPPARYAEMLGQLIDEHDAHTWLVNTGWTGGPFGVGERMKLKHTRRMVSAVLNGELEDVETRPDPFFGLAIPVHVEGVPDGVLQPRETWDDPSSYDEQAKKLVDMFRENFTKFDHADLDDAVRNAGP
jgi:phosphoenolpyruvate carboxykinase (ATP)